MEESDDESDYGEDMLTMVEDDDVEFLKNAINNQSYSILKGMKCTRSESTAKRRKLYQGDETLECEYEAQIEEPVSVRNLLPIKTKKGIVTRTVLEDKSAQDEQSEDDKDSGNAENELDQSVQSEEEYTLDENTEIDSSPKSSAELLAIYNETLRNKKVHIGFLCTNILENPEEKVSSLRDLLQMLDEHTAEANLSVRKLTVVSLLEVFKDILPSYQIKQHESGGIKLKKDTLKLQKYEEGLLQYYKKYLQKLETFSNVLHKKWGDTRQYTEDEKKLGDLSVHAMCDLLVAHPYFNFAPNIAQAVIPFLNHASPSVRQLVSLACKTVFKEDKKEEITLKILRIINQYLKNHSHKVKLDMLEVLIHLRIKDVNLDLEKEQDIKQKKLMSHKQNILQISKKERKRKKKLQHLEQEMLETKAEENMQSKQKNLTEITKIVFGIYFRILKSSTNTKVLGVCLEGLAKFSHCINLDYYIDLINLFDKLLKQERLGFREQLHCIQTVFTILSGQGEAINLDPSRFYTTLYSNLLNTHASRNHSNSIIVIRTLNDMLIKRRKKITNKRMIGFTKRIATLSLQLLHNGTLGCLGIIKTVLQLNKAVDVLLDLDTSVGNGDYQPELDDPEYCNAASACLFEMALLSQHYHPIVSKYARHIANGVPAMKEGSLPTQFGKCSPEQLYEEYDMSAMAFNPTIPLPKKTQPKSRTRGTQFTDGDFKNYCRTIIKSSKHNGFSLTS